MRNISEFLWTHSWDVGTLVPNNSEFLTWNSNISVLTGLKLIHLNNIVSLVGHLFGWIPFCFGWVSIDMSLYCVCADMRHISAQWSGRGGLGLKISYLIFCSRNLLLYVIYHFTYALRGVLFLSLLKLDLNTFKSLIFPSIF